MNKYKKQAEDISKVKNQNFAYIDKIVTNSFNEVKKNISKPIVKIRGSQSVSPQIKYYI